MPTINLTLVLLAMILPVACSEQRQYEPDDLSRLKIGEISSGFSANVRLIKIENQSEFMHFSQPEINGSTISVNAIEKRNSDRATYIGLTDGIFIKNNIHGKFNLIINSGKISVNLGTLDL